MSEKFNVFKLKIICCCLLLAACNSKDNNKPVIQFSEDSTAIVITKIDQPGYLVLEKKYKAGDSLNNIVSVLESPGDTDSLAMEKEFPGKLTVEHNQVIFIPEQPFIKGKRYIVSTIINVRLGSTAEAFTNELNTRAVLNQETLER